MKQPNEQNTQNVNQQQPSSAQPQPQQQAQPQAQQKPQQQSQPQQQPQPQSQSQPQAQQATVGVDKVKGKWQQQVGAAKIAWGKLTEDELVKSEGEQQKLSGLVQERYAISRELADIQVKEFLARPQQSNAPASQAI